MITLTWHASKRSVHKVRQRYILCKYKVHNLHQMYLWWSVCTLRLLACQVSYVGDLGLCCVCVAVFRRQLTSLFVDIKLYVIVPPQEHMLPPCIARG